MLRSELLRIRTSRATAAIAAVVFAEAVVGGLVVSFLPGILKALIRLNDVIPNATQADRMSPETIDALRLGHENVQATVADPAGGFGLGFSAAVIGAVVLGAFYVTNGYRHGSIALNALVQPSRIRLLGVKAAALTITVLAACLPLVIVRAGILAFAAAAQDVGGTLGMADLAGIWLRGAGSLVLFGLIGLGVGFAVRSPVASLTMIFTVLLVESSLRPIAALIAGGVTPANYLPYGLSADAVRGPGLFSGMSFDSSVGTLAAGIVLAAWTGALLFLGARRFVRDDIPVSTSG